jgi:hypothetical protein
MTNERVNKRCTRCGHIDRTSKLNRVCKRPERNTKGFLTGYRCPGRLELVVRRRKEPSLPPVPKGLGLGHVLSEEYQAQIIATRGQQWRDDAAKALAKALKWRKEAVEKQRRAEKKIAEWNIEIRALAKRTKMDDAQVEAVRQRAAKAAQVSHVKRRLSKSIEKELGDGAE